MWKEEELELKGEVKEAKIIVGSKVWRRHNLVETVLLIEGDWRRSLVLDFEEIFYVK
jgi:hypothetical protein